MPTSTRNVLFLFVLPPAALHAADRLIATLMTLLEAVTERAIAATRTPDAHGQAAQTLFFRLQRFLTTLIRISAFGICPPCASRPTTPSAPPTRPALSPVSSVPRRPGWLLDILPDIAPAVAADIGLMLADPALATLLEAAPTLHRALNPLLRALGLRQPPPARPIPPPPPPCPTPAPSPGPAARPSNPPTPSARRSRPSRQPSFHAYFVPAS